MLDSDEFGQLGAAHSIDTSCASHNSLGSAPLSAPSNSNPSTLSHRSQNPQRRANADLMAFLDDGPLPPPQRPRGPSVSSLSAMSMLSATSQTRPYTLPVDPPLHRGSTPPPSPPATPTPPSSSYHRHNGSAHSHPASTHSQAPFFGGLPRYSTVELNATARSGSGLREPAFSAEPDTHLPRYETKPRTEPITLAATLWRWGFFFFPFWFIGMFM
jgi:hypothetical protein